MPTVELIDPSAIPASTTGQNNAVLIQDAVDNLQRALRGNQGLTLRLGPDERDQRYRRIYKAAAKELNIGLRFVGAEPRTYQSTWKSATVTPHDEFGVIYIRITRASTRVASESAPLAQPRAGRPAPTPLRDNGTLPRRPITITYPIPVRDATGALVSR